MEVILAGYNVDADIIAKLKEEAELGGHFVLMSNGSFGGIYERLQAELSLANETPKET